MPKSVSARRTVVLRLALSHGIEHSMTFRQLVRTLNSSDVIVYIEAGRCKALQPDGCILVAVGSGGSRHLRIRLNPMQPLQQLIPLLAHELQHAVEISEAPDVVDTFTLVELYRRIGERRSVLLAAYETRRALRIADTVRSDLQTYESTKR